MKYGNTPKEIKISCCYGLCKLKNITLFNIRGYISRNMNIYQEKSNYPPRKIILSTQIFLPARDPASLYNLLMQLWGRDLRLFAL